MRLLQVPVGRNVEELAKLVEQQINEGEQHKKQVVTNYKPNLVKIGALTEDALLAFLSLWSWWQIFLKLFQLKRASRDTAM